MIAVDTSALMAIVWGEASADAGISVLEAEVLISAATVAEAVIVASRRNVDSEMARLIVGLGLESSRSHRRARGALRKHMSVGTAACTRLV